MGVRAFDRIPVLIDVQIKYHDSVYTGTLINLSERGMFIRTNKIPALPGSDLEVTLSLKGEEIHLAGKPVRKANIRGLYDGIGVELVNPPQNYLDFLDSLLAVL